MVKQGKLNYLFGFRQETNHTINSSTTISTVAKILNV